MSHSSLDGFDFLIHFTDIDRDEVRICRDCIVGLVAYGVEETRILLKGGHHINVRQSIRDVTDEIAGVDDG